MFLRNDAPLARWGRLTLKELRETLRDRRTILTLVLMPVLVYPMLGLVFQKFVIAQFTAQAAPEYRVAFATPSEGQAFRLLFSQGNQRLGKETEPGKPTPPKPGEPPEPKLSLLVPEDGTPAMDLETLIADQTADLGVRLQQRRSGRWVVEFVVLEGSSLGRAARQYVEERFRAVNEAFVAQVFGEQQPPLRMPITWTPKVLPGSGAAPAFSLSALVPLILILMTVTGAVYPAIDLTAGERERGTLEALIAAPVPRYQILSAKYAAVLVVVLLTAIVNLSAMVATGFATGLEQALFGREGLSFDLLWKLLVLLTVFAMFFSAVILTLTSIARSFKEAQAYLIPLMLMSMAPGVLAMFPGMEMTPLWAITPLANIVLLTRDLFDNRASAGLAAITLIATAGYAGVALVAAARVFGTDAVLYGSSSTWTDLFRRPEESRRSPDWTQGLIALGGLFPAYVLLGGIPARLTDWSLSSRLGASAFITVLLFAVWPSALAYLRRIDWRGAFRWHTPAALAVAGAVCWGLSLWPFVYELELRTLSTERVAALTELFRSLEAELRAIPLAWKLFALAVVPAACEELFFRGFLFQAIRSATGPWVTILLTAGLFGLFHVLVRDALLLERLLPTALMGIALGWVCHRTGSVLPGMLLHVLHNGSLLSVDRWFPALNSQATAETTTGGVGLPVLAVAAAMAVAGWCCFRFGRSGAREC